MANIKMENEGVAAPDKKLRTRRKTRDTTLVRIDKGLKEGLKRESERTHESLSKLMDWAVEEYLESVKALD